MPRLPRSAVPLDPSPAVERAATAARASAEARSRPTTFADWFAALLADEDGHPAALVARLGPDPARLTEVVGQADGSAEVPFDTVLYTAAQELAIRLRGDANLTTDMALLAVLDGDETVRRIAANHGLDAEAVRRTLLSPDIELPGISGSPPTPPPVLVVESRPVAARVVDANLNRAREALRVIEDYCRFGLDDRRLTETIKSLRHRLAAASDRLPEGTLLAARDTEGDVGTTVGTAAEYERGSPARVAAANCKRLQEALRSVEEFGKVLAPEFGRAVEPLRYETYMLEKAILANRDLRSRLADARLYVLLTADDCIHGLERTIAEAAAGGASVFQLREKAIPDRELFARAEAVRRWTADAGVLFIVNDRADVAVAVGADGVHVGQDDLPIAAARKAIGPNRLVGVSTHDLDQVRESVTAGADYLGVGPTFPSRTKTFDHYPGLDFVRAVSEATPLPAFVLGGVDAGNIDQVIASGGGRVAVAAAVTSADDPRMSATALYERLGWAKNFPPDYPA